MTQVPALPSTAESPRSEANNMTPDAYLQQILQTQAVDTGPFSPVRGVQTILAPLIQGWAGNRLLSITPSGSFAKGTAIRSGTDLDLFISLSEGTTETLKEKFAMRVECSPGHCGEPTPTRFSCGGAPVEVVDAWLGSDHRYFELRGDDGACYILRNDVMSGRW
jgi:hypothetical protein